MSSDVPGPGGSRAAAVPMTGTAAAPVKGTSGTPVKSGAGVSVRSTAGLPVPRTAVPIGIADPVENARAELKAALFAIEEKANVPKRAGLAADNVIAEARGFQRKNPAATAAIVVAGALAVGTAVWGLVRLYTR